MATIMRYEHKDIFCTLVEEERFWSKVRIGGSNECWEWLASKRKNGNGQFWHRGKVWPAHRFAWTLLNGPIPEHDGPNGMCVCFKCDNKSCVNPKHLFTATHEENMRRRDKRGRCYRPEPMSGEAHPLAKLKKSEVIEIRRKANEGMSHTALAHKYNVSVPAVNLIIKHKRWKQL